MSRITRATRLRFAPASFALTLALALPLLAACGPLGPGSASVVATDADKGHTLTLHLGDTLVVSLASTYWQVEGSSDTSVLRASGQPAVAPSPGCVPGSGCGTVTQSFTAVATGTADVTASRTGCGEARRCTGDEGHYQVTVVVKQP